MLAAAIACGLWYVWPPSESAPPVAPVDDGTTDSRIESASVDGDATESHDEAADDASSTERVGVEVAEQWTVTGTTTQGRSKPYPRVSVRIRLWHGYEAEGDPQHDKTVESDSAGEFRCPLPTPTSAVVVRASGAEPDHVSYGETELVVAGAAPPRLEVTLYKRDCTVAGTVRSVDGTPIEGAEIRASGHETSTDSEGEYSITAASNREEVYLYATAKGFAQSRAIAKTNGPGSTASADFELRPSLLVRGRVVDASGAPIEGANVRTFFTRRNAAITDASGRYELDHLDPQRGNHSVYARLDGYVEASTVVTVQGEHEVDLPDLVMLRGARVAGWVRDEAGTPLPGIELYIGFSPAAYNRLDAITRDDGSFEFPNVPFGDQTLVALSEDHAPNQQVLLLTKDEPVRDGIEIRLARGRFIGGIAKDEEGNPRPGVSFSARYKREYIDKRSKTDEEGRFRLEGLPAEDVDLEFYGRGIVRTNVAIEKFDHEDLEVVLPSAAGIAGRVVDAATGEALQNFRVRLFHVQSKPGEPQQRGYSATWSREGHRFTDTDGYWETGDENLVPGAPIGVEVIADGYAPARDARVLPAVNPDRDALVHHMMRGAVLTGRVFDAKGMPVPNARIAVRASDDQRRYFSHEPHETNETATAADGTFGFDAVTPVESILMVQANGRPMLIDGPFAIPDGGRIERIVNLPGGGTLRGKLLDAAGAPIGNARLLLYANEIEGGGHYSTSSQTAADGGFEFEDLPDGLYQLSQHLEAGEQNVHGLTVFARLKDGRGPEVIMQPRGSGTIRGTIRMKDGGKVPAIVPVRARPPYDPTVPRENGTPMRGALARNGKFEIRNVPLGNWQLNVHLWRDSGHVMGSGKVDVGDGEASVEIVLQRQGRRR